MRPSWPTSPPSSVRPRSASLAHPPAFGDNAPMPPEADFTDAHRRHWADAELLFEHDRWANADHLYGLSAECGLKAVMEEQGETIAGEYKKHVRELWPRFVDFMETAGELWSEFPEGEPFDDWSHHDRYAHQGLFQLDDVKRHRDAAERICRMVKWQLQGIGT